MCAALRKSHAPERLAPRRRDSVLECGAAAPLWGDGRSHLGREREEGCQPRSSHLGRERGRTPTAFHQSALGCARRATLGHRTNAAPTLKGLHPCRTADDATPLGLAPFFHAPRVGASASRQPWAGRWNAVGVQARRKARPPPRRGAGEAVGVGGKESAGYRAPGLFRRASNSPPASIKLTLTVGSGTAATRKPMPSSPDSGLWK